MIWLIPTLAAYLFGSLPTGVLVGRFAGRDPRKGGSGNIGASNVTRTLGKGFGAFVLVVDLLKGVAAVVLARMLAPSEADVLAFGALAAFSAVVGHCYPIWLKFKGGKGVATAFGVMAVQSWPLATLAALVWIALVVITRIPTIGSLVAAGMFALLTKTTGQPFEVHVSAIGLAVVIAIRHQSNIRVLIARQKETPAQRRARRRRQRSRR